MKRFAAIAALCLLSIAPIGAYAAEIGHFNGGFLNIRDFFVPAEPGFYAAVYNFYYTPTAQRPSRRRGRYRHRGLGTGVSGLARVDVDMYVLSPVVIWEPT